MTLRPSLIQRAYELALQCSSIAEIRKKLAQEGFVNAHAQLSSPSLRRQLRAMTRKRDQEQVGARS